MSEPETHTPLPDPFPEGTEDAGLYPTRAIGLAHCAVVLAMGETCWLVRTDAGWHLRVKAAVAAAARGQLARYERESIGWPPRRTVDPAAVRGRAPWSPLLWAVAVAAVFRLQASWPGLTDAWLLAPERVFAHGEWWRPFTALWLHGDLGHLVSNLGGGLWVFFAVLLTFGVRRGWAWLLVSSVAGNVAAAAARAGSDYRSLGASTAVFAGLGLLVGRAVVVAARGRGNWRSALVPLFSGVAVLGLFGAGGVDIDVLAHGTGFAAGALTGALAEVRRMARAVER